ncbi:MAG: hypothetical protein LQ352_007599 [Teloschistes flavicans]|nr:MAG: hypothetical protein LQ352_007599 [Teloschistes flavicans]
MPNMNSRASQATGPFQPKEAERQARNQRLRDFLGVRREPRHLQPEPAIPAGFLAMFQATRRQLEERTAALDNLVTAFNDLADGAESSERELRTEIEALQGELDTAHENYAELEARLPVDEDDDGLEDVDAEAMSTAAEIGDRVGEVDLGERQLDVRERDVDLENVIDRAVTAILDQIILGIALRGGGWGLME